MIYVTGDKHGVYTSVEDFCRINKTTKDDLLIVLGDNGVNFLGEKGDRVKKKALAMFSITFMMIRGNHDQRPSPKLYHEKFVRTDEYSGRFLIEDKFPNLLFAQDGETYQLRSHRAIVIGGAYSVDKDFRLEQQEMGNPSWRWFPDEQLTPLEMKRIEEDLKCQKEKGFDMPDIILSHTCPLNHKPYSKIVPGYEGFVLDEEMEKWLNKIERIVPYEKWYCGHWHLDEVDRKLRFVYHDFLELV